ncbi:MAG: undecaprenyl-phosphate glucose phosphotransferase [Rhodobacteraceae bacterium]|nr:undecaprenyl-phosphate glucose phosphotransferase [Paracoccaceae bacterium]
MRQTLAHEFRANATALPRAARLRLQPDNFVQLIMTVEGLVVIAWVAGWLATAGIFDLSLRAGGVWLMLAASAALAYRLLARADQMQHLLGGLDQTRGGAVARAARAWAVVLPATHLLAHALGDSGLANSLTGALAVAALSCLLLRLGARRALPYLIANGHVGLRVAVAGGGAEARETLERVGRMRGQGVHLLGLFDDREEARSALIQQGVAKMGRIAQLPDFVRRTPTDLIIVTMPPSAEARIGQILSDLWVLPVDIRLSPVRTSLIYRPGTYRWLGDVPLLDLFDRPLRLRDALVKRSFDLIIGAFLLVLLAPVMAIIALAIKLDSPGPVFFRQAREGYNGAPFMVWKFRSLHHHKTDQDGTVSVQADDERVTRLGRFLRRTSLDELPQLFNVLKGDMSLVGPRPHALGARNRDLHFAQAVRDYAARHRMKPGMTGWAQINGLRGPVETPEQIRQRVSYDLDYIDRWSPVFDLCILVRTIPSVLAAENAV